MSSMQSLTAKDAALQELKERAGMVRSRLVSLQELQRNLEGFDEGVRTIMSSRDHELNGRSRHYRPSG